MAIYASRIVNLPEAEVLADLHGARYDLETALGFCRQLAAMDLRAPEHYVVGDALSTAIAVRYSRCFKTGVRAKIPADLLDALSDEEKEAHRYVLTLRDKHIAHSVNSLEDNQVTIGVREPPDPPLVGNVGSLGSHFAVMSRGDVEAIGDLCESLLAAVDQLIEKYKAVVQNLIEGLPVTTVYEFPRATAAAPNLLHLDRSRKR